MKLTVTQKRERRLARGQSKVPRVRDRRRFKTNSAPLGVPRTTVAKGLHTTKFPNMVVDWSPELGETILKSGVHNSKIGGDVLVGALKGAKIFTLTLEERATCPKTCGLYRECYGNSLNWSKRWKHGKVFERHLDKEVGSLCAEHDRVLVRLHILGDFYSFEYLALWVSLLDRYENLHVFGFTAHQVGSDIGDGISRVRKALGKRFAIRHSGACKAWGAFTLDFPTEQQFVGDAVVCPEQRAALGKTPHKKEIHCGSCGVCWHTNRPIAFIIH